MLLVLLLALSLCYGVRSTNQSSVTIRYQVWEEQPAGTRVGRLLDDLRQREEGGHLEDFQVVEHRNVLPFSVGTRDGLVSTQGRLDREELCRGSDLCELAFSVLYRRSGFMSFLWVRVEVMDLNDNSPGFPAPLQEVEISESAGLRMRIPLDRAVDPDAGPNGLQTYSLSVNQHFALDVTASLGGARQAELVVIRELDREVQAMYDLTLVAWDKGNPPRSGSTLVRVNIQDSNDNSPTFEDSTPTVELSEDTTGGTTIIHLRASDPDQGANGEVEYTLSKHTPPEVQKLFHVDPQTGAVSLRASLDHEAQASHEVIVQARDHGPNAIAAHSKLHVKVRDVNDNAPRIHMTWTPPNSPVATVLEGAPEDTFLALVMVSDADAGDNGKVRAQLQQESGPFRLKWIHGNNYMIVTNGSLDREVVMQYNISLLAQDYGDPPLSCVKHLLVRVLDENDNPPVFTTSLYKASFEENNAVGYRALIVEANDMDLEFSGRVSYFIRSPNEVEADTRSFSVHPTSGVITVLRPLDYEESHRYSFVVEAVDQGHPPLTGTASVQIDVQDVNDNRPVMKEPKPRKGGASLSIPVNTDKAEIVMEEGSAALPIDCPVREGLDGFLAYTLKAEDPDSGLNGQLKYIIVEGNTNELFWLEEATGRLFVNTANATELVGKTFRFNIAVSDMGSPSMTTVAALEVTFVNFRDHLKNSSPGNRGRLSLAVMLAVSLGATCLLLLLAVALVTTFCRPEKRDGRAYNCRRAESAYDRHPRRPQKIIRKSDIQLIPVIRGRKDASPKDDRETWPLSPPPKTSDNEQTERQYASTASVVSASFLSQGYPEGGATQHTRMLRKPGTIELEPPTQQTLCQARNPSSSSSASHSSIFRRRAEAGGEEAEPAKSGSQATLRRPRTSEGRGEPDVEHRQILRDLVRLSMAAFGDTIELSSASPEVQQISQLLSLLHEGQLQPRPNFRGNKFSHRRYGGQDCSDWLSTKDSGHGESEAGDVDWEPERDSPIDPQLLHSSDDVFAEVGDTPWMARLSLPFNADYHDNVFVPDGLSSPERERPPRDALDSSSFSTFGKAAEKDGPLGGALLSEVSTLFEMLMTQKADAHPGPRHDVLYRLSAAYRRSLAPDATAAARNSGNCGTAEKRSGPAAPLGLHQ
uniref:Cadherin domain-containing protein n=1 Tax=Gasterosteus aculeatus aculeatus TaxID=481459 RepID=G3PVF4_GASAC|nr:protocadherin-12 isoform X1 [Gasterosteus aculeatus aculeatus]XP_040029695.1 protocadherin-12 isoform X1 [Gasterosteus aculeatus aculeatus]XP_040029696.1 protocadherin-12 isoform X1 [Gasterosteus aculeatus aculeatus]